MDLVVLNKVYSIALSTMKKTEEPPENTSYCHTKFTGETQTAQVMISITWYFMDTRTSWAHHRNKKWLRSYYSKTSLVVQWLSVRLPMQESLFHPWSHNYWSLCSRTCVPQEKLPQRETCALQLESSLHSPQLEKVGRHQRRPSTAKKEFITIPEHILS